MGEEVVAWERRGRVQTWARSYEEGAPPGSLSGLRLSPGSSSGRRHSGWKVEWTGGFCLEHEREGKLCSGWEQFWQRRCHMLRAPLRSLAEMDISSLRRYLNSRREKFSPRNRWSISHSVSICGRANHIATADVSGIDPYSPSLKARERYTRKYSLALSVQPGGGEAEPSAPRVYGRFTSLFRSRRKRLRDSHRNTIWSRESGVPHRGHSSASTPRKRPVRLPEGM